MPRSGRQAGVQRKKLPPMVAGVQAGEPLFSVHAQSRGELEYALDYTRDCTTIFELQDIEP